MVLKEQLLPINDQFVPQVLVWWKSLPQEVATWEHKDAFQAIYSDYNLEDKVKVDGEGIDRNESEMSWQVDDVAEKEIPRRNVKKPARYVD